MRNVRAHCVPMALVVTAACVFWLQDTPRRKAASAGIATAQPLNIDVARGMLAVSM